MYASGYDNRKHFAFQGFFVRCITWLDLDKKAQAD
jgi:hypothetical protein